MSISLGIWVGCKSVSPVATSTNYGIIGSWEGCDGRVVTFSADENGKYNALPTLNLSDNNDNNNEDAESIFKDYTCHSQQHQCNQ